MTTKVYLSTAGAAMDVEKACVSVFDRGFLFGDNVFETLRTAGGWPMELARHLARLRCSAGAVGIEVPWSDTELTNILVETHAASGHDESYVRMIVSRGSGPILLDPRTAVEPLLAVVAQPLLLPTEEAYDRGISAAVVVVQGRGVDPSIKSGNYLLNIQALRQAIATGGEDAILCSEEGWISEGVTSNVFVVKDENVTTPPSSVGLLSGITREVVCRLAADVGIEVVECAISHDQLLDADELFLTSSVRALMPVTRLDGQPVGAGRQGPVTRRLRRYYEAYVAEHPGAVSIKN